MSYQGYIYIGGVRGGEPVESVVSDALKDEADLRVSVISMPRSQVAGADHLVQVWWEPTDTYEGVDRASRRVFDLLSAATSWQLTLFDQDGERFVTQRDALTSVA